jgi:hypothetical protein
VAVPLSVVAVPPADTVDIIIVIGAYPEADKREAKSKTEIKVVVVPVLSPKVMLALPIFMVRLDDVSEFIRARNAWVDGRC